ncbi:hypothetical protein DL767_006629 [Monosporascus sp. MG133]|nr:hypothetical protein DL767_006629 [Monosporascus sp. MG133]
MGAGVERGETYAFAHAHGLMVVVGNYPNVGIAGGYIQCGGISILSSKLGLAADQVLSWEVITASGDLATANPTEDEEFFWALRDEGGSIYGVVVSMRIKAFPNTFFSYLCQHLFNVAQAVSFPDEVAANPYLRETTFSAVIRASINYTDWAANKATQDKITYDLSPALRSITPNGGGYLNEADFQAPGFQTTFYGDHYEQLLATKQKYDPDDIFYTKTAVGSDRREQHVDGRLCTT